ALDLLRFDHDVPVVGVLDPGVRSLLQATRNGRVGVIATVGTIRSGAYQRAVAATRAQVTLTCAACPGVVEFVERGETSGEEVEVLAERLLAPVKVAGVDTLLLGCTHYPFLARTIGDVMGRDVVLVSSADETAFEVRAILDETGLVRRSGRGGGKGRHRFVSSGDLDALVLSHEHPDHWTDLEGFYNVCRFVTGRQGFPVYAPAGLRAKTYEDTGEFLAWTDVGGGDEVKIGSLCFIFSRTDHGP